MSHKIIQEQKNNEKQPISSCCPFFLITAAGYLFLNLRKVNRQRQFLAKLSIQIPGEICLNDKWLLTTNECRFKNLLIYVVYLAYWIQEDLKFLNGSESEKL